MTEHTCPHCQRTFATEEPPETTAAQLATWCSDRGYNVSADDCVGEDGAAAILQRSPATLTNWRAMNVGPAFHRRGRVRYRLVDLAAFLNSDRND